jgi:hypothetical protein
MLAGSWEPFPRKVSLVEHIELTTCGAFRVVPCFEEQELATVTEDTSSSRNQVDELLPVEFVDDLA